MKYIDEYRNPVAVPERCCDERELNLARVPPPA